MFKKHNNTIKPEFCHDSRRIVMIFSSHRFCSSCYNFCDGAFVGCDRTTAAHPRLALVIDKNGAVASGVINGTGSEVVAHSKGTRLRKCPLCTGREIPMGTTEETMAFLTEENVPGIDRRICCL
jgi:hypothetical protein